MDLGKNSIDSYRRSYRLAIPLKHFLRPPSEQIRDFVTSMMLLTRSFLHFYPRRAHGETLNIASGLGVRIKDVIAKIVEVGGGKPLFGGSHIVQVKNMTLARDTTKPNHC